MSAVPASPMLYQEFAPGRRLAPYVEAYWLFRTLPGMPERQVVIPLTGCGKLIVVPAHGYVYFEGPVVTPQQVAVGGGVVCWGALFWPGAAAAFPQLDLLRTVGSCGASAPIWGDAVDQTLIRSLSALDTQMQQPILDPDAVARAATALDAALEPLLAAARALDPVVMSAVVHIIATNGHAGIGPLADALHLSPRQFRRRFHEATGISAKALARMRRVRSVTGDTFRTTEIRWSTIAAHRGFADQPHLVREFRRLTGTSPEGYRTGAREIALVGIDGTQRKEQPG